MEYTFSPDLFRGEVDVSRGFDLIAGGVLGTPALLPHRQLPHHPHPCPPCYWLVWK